MKMKLKLIYPVPLIAKNSSRIPFFCDTKREILCYCQWLLIVNEIKKPIQMNGKRKHNQKSSDFRKWSQVRSNLISFEGLREKTTQIQSFTKVCAIKESRFVQERSVLVFESAN